jgi:Tfp pilus assembly protein PilF
LEIATPMRSTMLTLATACALAAAAASDAVAQTSSSSGGFFGGLFGRSSNVAPPPTDASPNPDDPFLLKNQKKPGVELYVSVAHLYTETGKYAEAEDQYRRAKKLAPDDLRVLLGYAMLDDQMNRPDDALELYRQAEQKHPKEPAVYNNLAVHFIRVGMVPEAIEAARKAVELRPHEARYRNNLAALLVEAGQTQEAFKQLRAVYEEPVAHYDLGFLLNKRGLKPAALQEFTIALQMSPGMGLARQWVERLSRAQSEHEAPAMGAMPQQRPGVTVGPAYPREFVPAMNVPQSPQYMPPPQNRMADSAPVPPQYPSPQPPPAQPRYQSPSPAAPANTVPLTAARDPSVRVVVPEAETGSIRRLPPVNAPASNIPGYDQVAPDPPEVRR